MLTATTRATATMPPEPTPPPLDAGSTASSAVGGSVRSGSPVAEVGAPVGDTVVDVESDVTSVGGTVVDAETAPLGGRSGDTGVAGGTGAEAVVGGGAGVLVVGGVVVVVDRGDGGATDGRRSAPNAHPSTEPDGGRREPAP